VNDWQPAFSEPGPSRREVEEAIASITGQPVPPPEEPQEGAYAAFLQGWLAMTIMEAIRKGDLPLKGALLHQEVNAEGDYLPYFTVSTASGARIKVQFSQEGGDA
jgi:hypothetical protein